MLLLLGFYRTYLYILFSYRRGYARLTFERNHNFSRAFAWAIFVFIRFVRQMHCNATAVFTQMPWTVSASVCAYCLVDDGVKSSCIVHIIKLVAICFNEIYFRKHLFGHVQNSWRWSFTKLLQVATIFVKLCAFVKEAQCGILFGRVIMRWWLWLIVLN